MLIGRSKTMITQFKNVRESSKDWMNFKSQVKISKLKMLKEKIILK
jgi:hypothetical protein